MQILASLSTRAPYRVPIGSPTCAGLPQAEAAASVQSLEQELKRASSAAALTAAGHQTIVETLRAELAEGEATAAEAVAAAEGRTADAAAEAAAAEERAENAEARAARVEELAALRTASEATKAERLRREVARWGERLEATKALVATVEQALSEMEKVVEDGASAFKDGEEEAGAAASKSDEGEAGAAALKSGERETGASGRFLERKERVRAALAALREGLAAGDEQGEAESATSSVEVGPEVAGAEENGECGEGVVESTSRDAVEEEERAREREAAERELASLREILDAARADAGKTREEAAKQAEELSSHLKGALEEREEGLRREAAVSREVERLRKEIADAAEAAKGTVQKWTDKLKEAEKRAEAAETGVVGVVKSLEDALTQVGSVLAFGDGSDREGLGVHNVGVGVYRKPRGWVIRIPDRRWAPLFRLINGPARWRMYTVVWFSPL